MHENTSHQVVEAVVAAALHRVFASAPHAADSLEMWLEVTAEAVAQLRDPVEAPQWMPVFLVFRKQRTEARFYLDTALVHITSGPLTGTIHADLDAAAVAVVNDYHGYYITLLDSLPTWRFPHNPDPKATPRAA
ncbi:hypothetical protein [Nocardia miyunensis]|uniref:hypothetical protein n=1 Tax=Nocardia miyunensis TaxID=282684 RepID=UPI0008350692|nr:hypothetical protein [Nocardia miyunensis]